MDEQVRKIIELWGLKPESKTINFANGPKTEGEILSLVAEVFGEGCQVVKIQKNIELEAEAVDYEDSCERCRASGHWPDHTGGPFCFFDTIFLGKPCRPIPIEKAREKCPRGEE